MNGGTAPARLRSNLYPVQLPAPDSEEPLFQLRDPFKVADDVAVSRAGLALAVLFDGRRSLEEIGAAFEAQYGIAPAPEQVAGLAEALEAARLLVGPALEGCLAEYAASETRPPACIGSYPGEPAELRRFLEAQWVRAGGPGAGPASSPGQGGRIRGVISPHIDLHRGGHAYAHAWRPVAEACTAELFVIFGTSHAPLLPIHGSDGDAPPLYALTRKTFETPLGPLPVDQEAIDRLLAVYDGPEDLFAGEFHHKGEHSIEFQTVYLRHLFADRPNLRILPVLCGGLHEVQGRPTEDPRFVAFHRALKAALADLPPERVTFVAGIDLAHVGAQFDAPPIDPVALDRVSTQDRETLRIATEVRDPDAVHDDIAAGGDPRNICGHSALVGFLEALRDAPVQGELIHYDRWYDGASSVTFAGAVYREQEPNQ